MKKQLMSFLATSLVVTLAAPAMAAPLFPDLPADHWATDAVQRLAQKTIVKGYPDGTFKGDRAATRYEMAMIVSALLAEMEGKHDTFASKADLEELRALVDEFRPELDALGARMDVLEEDVEMLDERVTELERITFYGEVDARAVFQSFENKGTVLNYTPGGTVGVWGAPGTAGPLFTGGLVPARDYGVMVGTSNAFFNLGDSVLPVADYSNGRYLNNGTGFTAKALLGVRVRVSEDIDAGAEFVGFAAGGNSTVQSYWGVTPPTLANGWVGLAAAPGGTGAPLTNMNLDNFWIVHNPSNTKLILGSFSEDNMDDILYTGQFNPNAFGPKYNTSYGFDLAGHYDLGEWGMLHWEGLGTRLPNDSINNDSFLLGANLALEFEAGEIKVNWARAMDERKGGAGDIPFTEASPNGWVNAAGYFPGQAGVLPFGAPGILPNTPVGVIGGGIGPQEMTMFGISGDYKFDIGEATQLYVEGEWAQTKYSPNKHSNYEVDGDAFRIGLGTTLMDGNLDLMVDYVSVDATYDPYVLRYPTNSAGVLRLPFINGYRDFYSLHDVDTYPHNREGFRADVKWRFADDRAAVWGKYGDLDQKQSSLYTSRHLVNSISPGVPGSTILGYAPGFTEPVFTPYTGNSYAGVTALEDVKGENKYWGLGGHYKFEEPRIKLDASFISNNYKRDSALAVAFGGSENHIDLDITALHLGLGWEASDNFGVRLGADWVKVAGHFDPAGLYHGYAVVANSTNFTTHDTKQFMPFVGFDYDISENTSWSTDLRFYNTDDRATIQPGIYTNPGGALFTSNGGSSAHNFDWDGWQVSTQFKVKF